MTTTADQGLIDLDMPCGCPSGTAVRPVSEHDFECTGCGLVSA